MAPHLRALVRDRRRDTPLSASVLYGLRSGAIAGRQRPSTLFCPLIRGYCANLSSGGETPGTPAAHLASPHRLLIEQPQRPTLTVILRLTRPRSPAQDRVNARRARNLARTSSTRIPWPPWPGPRLGDRPGAQSPRRGHVRERAARGRPPGMGRQFLGPPTADRELVRAPGRAGQEGHHGRPGSLLAPQGVLTGGRETEAVFWGNVEYTLDVDTQKLGLWAGGSLNVYAVNGFGKTVDSAPGVLLPPNLATLLPAFGESGTGLMNLAYTHVLSPHFGIAAGKLSALGADFNAFAHDFHSQFMNTVLNSTRPLRSFPSPRMAAVSSSSRGSGLSSPSACSTSMAPRPATTWVVRYFNSATGHLAGAQLDDVEQRRGVRDRLLRAHGGREVEHPRQQAAGDEVFLPGPRWGRRAAELAADIRSHLRQGKTAARQGILVAEFMQPGALRAVGSPMSHPMSTRRSRMSTT
jgi:hypothetical protein